MYLRYLVKMKRHISYFFHYIKRYVHQSSSSTRENKLTVTRYVQNVHHWHEHKHTSMLAIGQLRHQSATAPSLATHTADAVAARQCHERDNDVIFTSHVK